MVNINLQSKFYIPTHYINIMNDLFKINLLKLLKARLIKKKKIYKNMQLSNIYWRYNNSFIFEFKCEYNVNE